MCKARTVRAIEWRKGDSTLTMTTTSMINQQKFFRNVLPRLFRGTAREIVIELLQNAQRAGGTRIDFAFSSPTTCVISDDGHGLVNGIEDLRTLLILADSHYQDEQVEEQQAPMGLGLYALIVHEGVQQLHIQSNGLSLDIDTRRWLHDSVYLESWEERVQPVQEAVLDAIDVIKVDHQEQHAGFHLQITGSEDLIKNLRAVLLCGNPHFEFENSEFLAESYNPVTGFQDLLDIFLDGQQVRIEGAEEVSLPDAEIITTYQGNEVRISLLGRPGGCLVVNWYGQLIFHWNAMWPFQIYLIVRNGQPVMPQAPTRMHLVQNEQLADLYAWAEDQLFAWASAWEHMQELPSPKMVARLYKINNKRASAECPMAVVQAYKPLPKDYLFETYEEYVGSFGEEALWESDCLGPWQTVRKRDLNQLLILREEVLCAIPAGHPAQSTGYTKEKVRAGKLQPDVMLPRSFEIGLTSLLRATNLVAYRAVTGIPEEQIGTFWWQPGEPADRYHTTSPGTWGVQRFPTPKGIDGFADCAACVSGIEWHPLPESEVFVADEPMPDDIEAVDWIIGVASTEQMPAFLAQYAYAAFVHDEDEWDQSEEDYSESVKRAIRTYRTNMIDAETPTRYLPRAVAQALVDGHHAIKDATWRFVYREHKDPEALLVTDLVLTWPDGHVVRLQLDY